MNSDPEKHWLLGSRSREETLLEDLGRRVLAPTPAQDLGRVLAGQTTTAKGSKQHSTT